MIVKCGYCKDEITSKHRHDWVACSCWTYDGDNTGIYIDGGDDYTRLGGDLENLTYWDDKTSTWRKLEL